ncbi:chromosomal replication initiator protein DnaA [[Mycoplasma] anseris]|uniref:Chromosomal replication initiator protein DnaA n=1 Tax=[Mycoplasma] anseris TaxID=92400 RepID=A0A2Z4NDF6_9BACT|nr:chromosomal replication initiator protein DnaA [[Mycoplasma] anseris]AWX69621.1 chromosomal replication initiator protein DnaA [[Mycoplasma] anseris]
MEEEQIELYTLNKAYHEDVRNNIDEFTYSSFFSLTNVVHKENKTIYIEVHPVVYNFVKQDYFSFIERTIKNITDNSYSIVLINNKEQITKLNVKTTITTKENNVKKDLTFANYAVGRFNSLALKAAKTIYESDKVEFSPLFIYASSGLGKTHLLHAIGNEFIKKNKSCLYINPDVLTRRLVENLKNKNQEEINKIVDELTAYDCLMFDDVQQYGNKESTLIVLFNIINTMINNNKQIIISADKKPEELGGFEERFITRFSGGLTIQISRPDINDVIDILNFKLKENNINPELWEEESLKFIARNFSNSIRNLEGAINRIKLFSQGDDYFTYDLTTMKMIFKNVSQVKDNITPERIIEVVAKYYKIDKKKITANTRKEDIVIARRISMWLIKNNFDYSLQNIGKMFGNQSHSTVIVSLNWIDSNIQSNSSLKLAIEKIKENLNRIL